MKYAGPEESSADEQPNPLRTMGRGHFRSSSPSIHPDHRTSLRTDSKALAVLRDRLQACDDVELARSLEMSEKGLRARLNGLIPLDVSQMIVVATSAGLLASELL